jgi:hybrid cluster-associated redox disulfide protein
MAEVTKESSIGEIVRQHPETIEVFLKYGLHCIGCPASMMETLEQGAAGHGMTEEDIKKMVEEINQKIKEKEGQ